MPLPAPASFWLLGVRLDPLSEEDLLRRLELHLFDSHGLLTVTTVNAECIALANRDPRYRQTINSSSLNLIDGAGINLAARLRGLGPFPRLPGADLIYTLAQQCQQHNLRLFLLGGAPEVAQAAGQRLQSLYPGLEIAFYSPLRLSEESGLDESQPIFDLLEEFSPHVLYVALGMPKQEKWIALQREQMEKMGVRLAIGVGGALDYISGRVPRAPRLWRRLGLEWLFRLLRQPRLRLRRQAERLSWFAVAAFMEALRLRWRKMGRPAAGR